MRASTLSLYDLHVYDRFPLKVFYGYESTQVSLH